MRSLYDPTARQEIVTRIQSLTANNRRRWGRLELHQMLVHLGDQLRMAVGGVKVERARGPLRFPPMRFLLVHVLPWPHGARAPREAFTTKVVEWESDRLALLALIERFAVTAPSDLKPLHPLFGRMTPRDWAVLSYRHLDHHLRQFSA